ncbi:MAG: beta-lactamase family protein [Saprospiraceae bacterium]|nr:beta-lactamase family protein [Saprospiraceae bacterium]MBK6478432.1 beta-lactamase family protein [Saprospiraceae bacterium]MBK6813929.1 beta-lactamase family protein [Saprospiraceae bacterium]MBK7373363.1 beta-lactamase family protein [Saprospiraceae bacterium]MBK7437038.1 beta-lactamase family protein [Saprospiraceae bacterium]
MRLIVLLIVLTEGLLTAQSALKTSLHDLLQTEWTQNQFSGVLLVAKNGKPIIYEAQGYADFKNKKKLTKKNIFELASVSKQFTSMIIMMLKERGSLSYDESLERYIPDLPYKGITIRQLLTHTSGIPDYQAIMDEHWDKNKIADNLDVIDYLKKYPQPILFKPGEKYQYSNTGYLLLASIAEAAAGKDFIDMVKTQIFKPLKMKSADFRTPSSRLKISSFATGHVYDESLKSYQHADDYKESNYTIWLGHRKGPGRISMNANDLLKWDRALYTPILVARTTLDEAWTPQKLNNGILSQYGFGWELSQHLKLGKIVAHSGDNPGYKTYIKRYIDEKYTVILLNNNASDRMRPILEKIEDLLAKY